MSKQVKALITEELRNRYQGVDSVLAVDPAGLSAVETNRVRGQLKAKQIQLMVVKNSLARRAFDGGPLSLLADRLLGSTALATGGESIIDVAKELVAVKKALGRLAITGAIVEGRVLDAEAATALAKMPGKRELQGMVVVMAQSPGRRVAGALLGMSGRIAGCIRAIVEKLEKQQAG